jgi:predicted heme/steroid binding protein
MNLLIKSSIVVATITALSVFAVDSTKSAPVAVKDTTVKAAVKDTTVKAAVVDSSKSAEKVFTIQELAAFTGKDGKSAYVAVDGVVYDMTKIGAWKNGEHHGIKAGTDATKKITSSPHGKQVLKKVPVVGKLAQK